MKKENVDSDETKFTRNMVDGLGLLTTLFDVGVTVEKLLFY